jgi:predicted Fe-Mo cluster-binding NifX family protein
MNICVTAQRAGPDSPVDPRFGRARFFVVYDDQSDSWDTIDNHQNLQAAQGAGIQAASHVVNAGCDALISGHCGPKAFAALSRAGVAVYTVAQGSVRQAVELLNQGKLTKIAAADVEGHW